jgi:predicted nucleic acid-binding Zn ribbon protein
MKKASKPTQLGDALKNFLDKSQVGERIEEAAVVPEWAERVGPAIAAVTVPLRVNRGTLLVGVRSSAWLMELNLMEREILHRINAGRGRRPIAHIRFLMLEDKG